MDKSDDNGFDLYEDPNPPQWPNNRTPFNRWYKGLHALLWALQGTFSPYSNPKGMRAKYLNIRVDTRNGSFLLFCEGVKPDSEERISPDDLGLIYKPVKLEELTFCPKDHAGNTQFW